MTDGTAEYNRDTYRVSFFYDLAKASVLRMAFSSATNSARAAPPPSRSPPAGCARR